MFNERAFSTSSLEVRTNDVRPVVVVRSVRLIASAEKPSVSVDALPPVEMNDSSALPSNSGVNRGTSWYCALGPATPTGPAWRTDELPLTVAPLPHIRDETAQVDGAAGQRVAIEIENEAGDLHIAVLPDRQLLQIPPRPPAERDGIVQPRLAADVRIAPQDVVVGHQTFERAPILFLDGPKQSLLESDDVRIVRWDRGLGEECADKQ